MANVETKIVLTGDTAGARAAFVAMQTSAKKTFDEMQAAALKASTATTAAAKKVFKETQEAEKKAFVAMQETANKANLQMETRAKATRGVLLGVAAASTVAFGAMVVIAKKATEAAGKQELAEIKLATALKNANVYTKESFQGMLTYANALQRTTRFEDENIIASMGLIQQFKKLSQEELQQLIPRVLDLAQSMGGGPEGLETASRLVAKTLGSSTNALARQGIEIDGNATGTERLNQLTAGLTTRMGGQAEAAAKSFEATASFSKVLGEISEEIGNLIIKNSAFSDGLKGIKSALWKARDAIHDNQGATSVLLGTTAGLTGATALLATGITGFGFVLPALKKGLLEITPILAGIKKGMTALGLLNPFIVVTAATQAFIEVVLALSRAWIAVENNQAKALNKDITSGAIWDKRIKELEEKRRKLIEAPGQKIARSLAGISIKDDPEIQKLDAEIARLKQVKEYKDKLEASKADTGKGTTTRELTDEEKVALAEKEAAEKEAAVAKRADAQKKAADEAQKLLVATRNFEMAGVKDDTALKLKYIEIDLKNKTKSKADLMQLEADKKELLSKIKDDEVKKEQETADKKAGIIKKLADTQIDSAKRTADIIAGIEQINIDAQKKNQDDAQIRFERVNEAFVSVTEQAMRTARSSHESFFEAFGKGVAMMVKQYIRGAILETAAQQIKACTILTAQGFVDWGASWAKIVPVVIASSAGIAALEALIPQMADGGIVRARSGGTLVNVGEGGRDEAIVPLGKGGYGGVNYYTFNISENVDLGLISQAIQRGNPAAINMVKAINRTGARIGGEV